MPKKPKMPPMPVQEPEPEPEAAAVPKLDIATLVGELVSEGREAALITGPVVNIPAGLALLDAAQAGDMHAAEQLLAAGASPDQEEHGFTPVILAAREGKAEMLKLLVERGGRIQPEDPTECADTALSAAVESASSGERLDAIASSYRAVAEAAGENEDKAAEDAVEKWRKQQNSLVVFLLEKSADPNRIDSSGYCALHYAAEGGNNLATRVLLRHEAKPDIRVESTGQTPLVMAAVAGAKGIVKQLLEKGGVDVDAQDEDGTTALMAAAANDNTDICELLLERGRGEPGASLELRCVNGSTALLIAAQEKATATAKYLIAKGADLTSQRETQCNCLSMAFVHGDSKSGKEPELARFLRVRGAVDPRKPPPSEAATAAPGETAR
jgi:ankyrin repeat protein